MKLFRDNIIEAQGYAPGEQPQDGSYVKLNTNENPYPPSPRAIEAIRAAAGAAGDDLRKYPDPTADDARKIIARLFGADINQVICGNGSDELLTMVIRATLNPGDALAAADPTYSLYQTLTELHGAQYEAHPCDDDFAMPVESLAASRAALMIVANPNAPTGLATPPPRLRELARSFSGLMVIDEAYADFADSSAVELAHTEPNVLVMRTLSKSYSLAGLRFGFMLGSSDLIAQLMKVKDSYNIDRLTIAGAAAALDDQQWMHDNVRKVRDERLRLTQALRELQFTVLESEANFVLARPPSGDAENIYLALKRERILVRYFKRPRIDQFLRISIGTPAENDALLAALETLLTAGAGNAGES